MKIVREHINEIKQNTHRSGLGVIGLGKHKAFSKFQSFLSEYFSYYHLMQHDRHGYYIAAQLGVPIEDVLVVGLFRHYADIDDILKILKESFGDVEKEYTRYHRHYYTWNFPRFILENSHKNNEQLIFCDKNITGWDET